MKSEIDPIVITPMIGPKDTIFFGSNEKVKFKITGKRSWETNPKNTVTLSGFVIPNDIQHKIKIEKGSDYYIEKTFKTENTTVTIKIKPHQGVLQKIYNETKKIPRNFRKRINLNYLKKKIKKLKKKENKDLKFWCLNLFSSIFSTIISFPLRFQQLIYVPVYNPERLGHAIGNTDTNLMEIAAGLHGKPNNCVLLNFYQSSSVQDVGQVFYGKMPYAKEFLSRLQIRGYKVYPGKIMQRVIEKCMSKAKIKKFNNRRFAHRDIFDVKRFFRLDLNFQPSELASFYTLIKKKNVSTQRPLVVFSCRESGKIPTTFNKKITDETRYGYRNTEQKTLLPGVTWLLEQGFSVVRVGRSEFRFPCQNKNFYDYASDQEKHSFTNDLFFFRQCCFYIGDTSGVYVLAELFRKPILFYNYAPVIHFNSWSVNYMTIFKKLFSKQGKYIPLSLQIKNNRFHEIHGEKLAEGYSYRSNTSEEILAGIQDMVNHVLQGHSHSKDHRYRMMKIQYLLRQTDLHLVQRAQICPSFLSEQT